jgi:hypothetical protein
MSAGFEVEGFEALARHHGDVVFGGIKACHSTKMAMLQV